MTQSPLSRYMAEQNARPVHTTRRRTLRSDLQDLRDWWAGRGILVSDCHQAPLFYETGDDGSTPEPCCEACGEFCAPVRPVSDTVLRLRWRSLWQWAQRNIFPGWLFVLMAVCVLAIIELNAKSALLNAAARCAGQ